MVPPTIFVSGGIAVLQLCKEIYLKYKSVKRYRDDCKKLAHFVHRVEGFLMETEEEADMTGPGWQAAFSALHESLLEVGEVFDDCAKYGIVRSLINADDINLRLSSIAQRMTMALQLIPIQKAKAQDKRLSELTTLQAEIRTATFAAARAAEEQSAQLKRLMDQSRVDASKTQEMLAQVLALLQQDAPARVLSAAAAAVGPLPPGAPPPGAIEQPQQKQLSFKAELGTEVCADQLIAEVDDLKAEMVVAQRDKKVLEEQYLAQIIAAIEAMELNTQQEEADDADDDVPADLLCPITYQLLEDPVILVASHQTYERAAIEEWLGRGNTKDPVTGIQLTSNALVPNVLARKLAQEWLEEHPGYRRRQEAAAEAAAAAAAAASAFAAQGSPSKLSSSSMKGVAASGNGCADWALNTAKAKANALQFEQQQYTEDADDIEFDLDPKAAAVLAAAQATKAVVGSSSSSTMPGTFDPSALFANKSSKQQQLLDTPHKQGYEVTVHHRAVTAPDGGLSEKETAQRAYAAAVAAAAAGNQQQQPMAVYAAIMQHQQQQPSASSPAAVAPAAGSQHSHQGPSMSSFVKQQTQQQVGGSSGGLSAGATSVAAAIANSLALSSPGAVATAAPPRAARSTAEYSSTGSLSADIDQQVLRRQQQQLRRHTPAALQQQQQRALQHQMSIASAPSTLQQQQPQAMPLPISGHATPAAGGGGAALAPPSSSATAAHGGTVTLKDFKTTFERMAAQRNTMMTKHGTQVEKIVEKTLQEQRQQQQEQLERQANAQRIAMYEQQYKLQRRQQLQRQQEAGMQQQQAPPLSTHSSITSSTSGEGYDLPHSAAQHQQQQLQQQHFMGHGLHQSQGAAVMSAPAHIPGHDGGPSAHRMSTSSTTTSVHGPQTASHAARAAPRVAAHLVSQDSSRSTDSSHAGFLPGNFASGSLSFDRDPTAAAANNDLQPHRALSANAAVPGHASSSAAAHPAASLPSATGSSKSGWGMVSRKSGKPPPSKPDDDTMSVSSDGSSINKRNGIGKGMRGLLKNISYAVVYQDDKC